MGFNSGFNGLNSIKDINVEINKEDEKIKYTFTFLEKSQKLAKFNIIH